MSGRRESPNQVSRNGKLAPAYTGISVPWTGLCALFPLGPPPSPLALRPKVQRLNSNSYLMSSHSSQALLMFYKCLGNLNILSLWQLKTEIEIVNFHLVLTQENSKDPGVSSNRKFSPVPTQKVLNVMRAACQMVRLVLAMCVILFRQPKQCSSGRTRFTLRSCGFSLICNSMVSM